MLIKNKRQILCVLLVVCLILGGIQFPGNTRVVNAETISSGNEANETLYLFNSATDSQDDVVTKIKSTVASVDYVKSGAYTAMQNLTSGVTVNGVPTDVSNYDKLEMTIYANQAVNIWVYFNSTFGRNRAKVELSEGWNEISLSLNELFFSTEFNNSEWTDITGLSITTNAWQNTLNPDISDFTGYALYYDRIALVVSKTDVPDGTLYLFNSATDSQDDVVTKIKSTVASVDYVKSGAYTAMQNLTSGVKVNGVPTDVSNYDKLEMTVYANQAVNIWVYFNSTFGRNRAKVELSEGWNEISLSLNELFFSTEFNNSEWTDIIGLSITTNAWQNTLNPDISDFTGYALYYDCIALVVSETDVPEEIPTPNPGEDGTADGGDVNTGNIRYYYNDCESGVMMDHAKKGCSITLEEGTNGNHYMFLNRTAAGDPMIVYTIENPTEYIVVSTDFATTNLNTTHLAFKGTGADGVVGNDDIYSSFVYFTADGKIMSKTTEKQIGTITTEGTFVNVAVAFNCVKQTYSVWIDNQLVLEDIAMPQNYGNVYYIRFYLSNVETTGNNLMIDNLKIFNGLTPDDFDNTVAPEENEEESVDFESIVYGNSPVLDYATEALAKIDAAGAVMLHTGSGYVYENGVRTLPAADDFNNKLAGETKILENEYGLVILSNSVVELSEAEIQSLQNYMLYTRPQAEQLQELFASNGSAHPRVIIDQEGFDKIKYEYQTNDLMKEWGNNVIEAADKSIQKAHVKYLNSDGTKTSAFRTILDNALNLSMAYKLTGATKYVDYLWEDLRIASEFPEWYIRFQFLDTGEFAAGFAIAYDWLYDIWTEEQKQILEEAMYNLALINGQRGLYGVVSWDYNNFVTSYTNRNVVCNGGLAMAAIALLDNEKYAQDCKDLLEKIYHALEIMLEGFAPDGAWDEGPAYWEYTIRFLSMMMETTENAFGTDFNIYKTPGFENNAEFYLSFNGMAGVNNLHKTAEGECLWSSYLFWISNILDKQFLTEFSLYQMNKYEKSGDVYSMIYYDTSINAADVIDMEFDVYHRRVEQVTMRSSWMDDAGIFTYLHAAHPTPSHIQVDAGNFILDIGGERFAGDYGLESATVASGSNWDRANLFRYRPEGHNCFVINPDETVGQVVWNAEEKDYISAFVSKEKGSYAVANLDTAYADYADSASRGIMLGDERRSVLIRDEIRGMKKEENQVYWFMQMPNVDVQIAEDKKSAILSKGGVDVYLQVLTDATNYEITITDPVSLETSPQISDQNANTGWKRLTIIFTSGKDLDISVKMAVLDDPMGNTPITDVSLADWSIEDGELAQFPRLSNLTIGGQTIVGFSEFVTKYKHTLPYGTEACPEIVALSNEECNITISTPETLPGTLSVKLIDKDDPKLQTIYTVNLEVQGEIELEVSGAQDGNPPENCLDKDMTTRWAVEGEAWGVFTFAEPKNVSSVWLATWLGSSRQLMFDIHVSVDGENFVQVWSGTTALLDDEEQDKLEEFEIPEGIYKAIKLTFHGTTAGLWNSILEVEFTY